MNTPHTPIIVWNNNYYKCRDHFNINNTHYEPQPQRHKVNN